MSKLTDERTRFSELYFGQTAQIFTVLGAFQLQPNSLKFDFETWASVESFESGALPTDRLRREFLIEGDSFETFQASNFAVLTAIKNTALNIAGVGGRGFQLEYLYLSTVGKVLVITAQNPANKENTTTTKPGVAFDETIAANLDLITQAVSLTWTYGKENDQFLAQMTQSFANSIKSK